MISLTTNPRAINEADYLVLRMGYGKPNITTPRRCVQDVLLEKP